MTGGNTAKVPRAASTTFCRFLAEIDDFGDKPACMIAVSLLDESSRLEKPQVRALQLPIRCFFIDGFIPKIVNLCHLALHNASIYQLLAF